MSRATGDGLVGRRSVPPLDCGSVSAGTEPRRERPHPPPRSVTLRAALGSFTSRFRESVFACRCGAAASSLGGRRAACLRARSCATFERSKRSHDSGYRARDVDRIRADNHTAIVPRKASGCALTNPGRGH